MMSVKQEDGDCSSYSRQKARGLGVILGAGMMGDAAGTPRGA